MTDPRTNLAEDRTDLAEDRTLLANERTYSGWVRTSLGAIGVGLAFHAFFPLIEPSWVPKAIATVFIIVGTAMVVLAERRACRVRHKLTAHQVPTVATMNLRFITIAICCGAIMLLFAIWLLI